MTIMSFRSILKFIFTFSAIVFCFTFINAQVDYSNIKVDQLSDAQIAQMMKRMGEMGYSQDQLEKAASERGMNVDEIKKLKERAATINQPDALSKEEGSNSTGAATRTVNGKGNPVVSADTKKNSRIFGADLFSSGASTFEPNMRMATPKNYVIGPDDELLVDLTGDNEASYKLKVSPEGTVSLQYVGIISVGGLSIEQATNKIRNSMSGTYPALRSGRTQLAVNLGNIRSISIIINGEVVKPGSYTLSSFATVFNALYAAGGPNDNGSYRNIQVIRNNRVVATVDLYDFLVNGIQAFNIRLQDQDVIHVPVYQIHVDVLGEVKRSAIYELRADESLADVLKYAGGFGAMAYKQRVRVIQNTATEHKVLSKSILEFPEYKPKNGDVVFVDPILDRYENKIEIVGAVFRPGIYELTSSLTLSQLIKQADGVKEDAFYNRGYITRLNLDNTSSVISFNVSDIIKGTTADILLKREDVVQIFSIFDLRDSYTVSIGGEVRKPGKFNYFNNLSVETLIQMAGGLKEGASAMNIEVSRRVAATDLTQKTAPIAQVFTINVDKNLILSDSAFILQPFDIVSVRPVEGYVFQKQISIVGEVLHPGIYTIQSKNERISDIIKRAGGLTVFAYAKGASLKREGINNAYSGQEDELSKLNLARLKQTGANDSTLDNTLAASSFSDLVGIQLEKILEYPGSRNDLVLEGGDIIKIPALLQTVKVTGEVLRPISVVYQPGKSFKYYINSAGGFTKNSYKRGSFVSSANGAVAGTTKALFFNNYPTIAPGAEIAVPVRAKREGLNAQGWIGMGTAVASLAAIIVTLLKR